jgi:flagellar biosynthesis/type III secretory pathway chaperone
MPSLDRLLAELEDLLCRELDCYRDLLDIMLKEKQILSANRPESLPDVIEEQKRVLMDTREIEPRRMDAMRRLGAALGIAEPPTLRAITERLSGDDRVRVEKMREALAHVVPRVDKVNRINVLLIRNSMSFISSTVRTILEESTPRPPTYAASGQTSPQGEVSAWTDRRA